MATPSQRQLLGLVGALLVGLLIGFLIRDVIPNAKQILPLSCTYEGRKYKSGEGFPSSDGCNSCSCQHGQVGCTMMACEWSDFPDDSSIDSMPPPPPIDEVACTMDALLCPDGSSVGRIGPNCEFAPCPVPD